MVFFSYDVSSFFLVTWLSKLLRFKIVTFEHNTIPKKNRFQKIFHLLASKNITRVCYTPDGVSLYQELGKLSKLVLHPIIEKAELINRVGVKVDAERVFCPSASGNLNRTIEFSKKHPDKIILLKTSQHVDLKNVKTATFFEDYNQILASSGFIYLPVELVGRISGPFYEAISINKLIIVRDNEFGRFVKKSFPNNVLYDDVDFLEYARPPELDIKKYNEKADNMLWEVIFGA